MRRVIITGGLAEFVGKVGTVVGVEFDGSNKLLRVELDEAVDVPALGRVYDDLWAPHLLKTIRARKAVAPEDRGMTSDEFEAHHGRKVEVDDILASWRRLPEKPHRQRRLEKAIHARVAAAAQPAVSLPTPALVHAVVNARKCACGILKSDAPQSLPAVLWHAVKPEYRCAQCDAALEAA